MLNLNEVGATSDKVTRVKTRVSLGPLGDFLTMATAFACSSTRVPCPWAVLPLSRRLVHRRESCGRIEITCRSALDILCD